MKKDLKAKILSCLALLSVVVSVGGLKVSAKAADAGDDDAIDAVPVRRRTYRRAPRPAIDTPSIINGHTPLEMAVERSFFHGVDEIRDVIARGATVNLVSGSGKTPLYYAVVDNNLEAVRVLLEAGADPNIIVSDFMSGRRDIVMAFIPTYESQRKAAIAQQIRELLMQYGSEFRDSDPENFEELGLSDIDMGPAPGGMQG